MFCQNLQNSTDDKCENYDRFFFAGPTLVTPTESSALCSPTLPTTACSSFSPSIFDSSDADTTMMEEESVAISLSSKSSTKNRSAKGQELIQIAESLNFASDATLVFSLIVRPSSTKVCLLL